jgi:hypothetical protein
VTLKVILGGGMAVRLSPRTGLRFEARGEILTAESETQADARPGRSLGPPSAALSLPWDPTIQFSNVSVSPSSLGLPGVDNFRTRSSSSGGGWPATYSRGTNR